MNKNSFCQFIVLLITFFCICAITSENLLVDRAYGQSVVESRDSLSDDSNLQEESLNPIVKYIPGLFSFNDPQEDVLEKLKDIYDTQRVETIIWYKSEDLISGNNDSKLTLNIDIWNKSVALAEKTAEDIFQGICEMPKNEQENLILVGHSLGGRIVVLVLDKLHQKNLKIRQAILLGAAMDNNDPCIPNAVHASIDTVYSFVNPTDECLTLPIAIADRAMLGTGCSFYLDPKRFCEIQLDSIESHKSKDYLNKLKSCVLDDEMRQNCIIVPQGKKNIPAWFDPDLQWVVADQCQGWTLYKDNSELFYIVDDLSLIRAKGSESAMKESFLKVKKQLEAGVFDGERESTKNFNNIPVQQGKPVTQKLGSSKELYWKNKRYYKGWRLQLNSKTETFRILDPSSRVRAQGDKYAMEDAFNAVKKQIQNNSLPQSRKINQASKRF